MDSVPAQGQERARHLEKYLQLLTDTWLRRRHSASLCRRVRHLTERSPSLVKPPSPPPLQPASPHSASSTQVTVLPLPPSVETPPLPSVPDSPPHSLTSLQLQLPQPLQTVLISPKAVLPTTEPASPKTQAPSPQLLPGE